RRRTDPCRRLPPCPARAARHSVVRCVWLRRQERRERRVARSGKVHLLLRRVRTRGSAAVTDPIAFPAGSASSFWIVPCPSPSPMAAPLVALDSLTKKGSSDSKSRSQLMATETCLLVSPYRTAPTK